MAAVLSKSDVVVNSFVKGAPQSIVNKIGDYLASGKPMINTLENPVFCKLIDDNCVGVNIEPENLDELIGAIIYLYENGKEFAMFSSNARKCSEEKFDRKETYVKIEKMINELISNLKEKIW